MYLLSSPVPFLPFLPCYAPTPNLLSLPFLAPLATPSIPFSPLPLLLLLHPLFPYLLFPCFSSPYLLLHLFYSHLVTPSTPPLLPCVFPCFPLPSIPSLLFHSHRVFPLLLLFHSPSPPPPPIPPCAVIEGDYAVCMQHLMRFPVVYEVNYLVQRALHLRSPVSVYIAQK